MAAPTAGMPTLVSIAEGSSHSAFRTVYAVDLRISSRHPVAFTGWTLPSPRCPAWSFPAVGTEFYALSPQATGAILCTFDMLRDFETVNGVSAKGGSMGSSGPTVAQAWFSQELGIRESRAAATVMSCWHSRWSE